MIMRLLFLVAPAFVAWVSVSLAAQDAVPVMVRADGNLDTCALGETTAATAVRAGPGTSHRKTDTLEAGTRVWMFDEKDGWLGLAYGSDEIECPPVGHDKAYDGPGRSGWVKKHRVRLLAG